MVVSESDSDYSVTEEVFRELDLDWFSLAILNLPEHHGIYPILVSVCGLLNLLAGFVIPWAMILVVVVMLADNIFGIRARIASVVGEKIFERIAEKWHGKVEVKPDTTEFKLLRGQYGDVEMVYTFDSALWAGYRRVSCLPNGKFHNSRSFYIRKKSPRVRTAMMTLALKQ